MWRKRVLVRPVGGTQVGGYIPPSESLVSSRSDRAAKLGSTRIFSHHTTSSPWRCTARWCPRHSGTNNSSLYLRPRARPRPRRLPPDLGERQVAAVATNVLDCSFEAAAPNRKWIPDSAYVSTAEGWLYVAAVIDHVQR